MIEVGALAASEMKYRALGATGIQVSEISFGSGPVPALMTSRRDVALQAETVSHGLAAGINWFDTAASYGDGASETSLGAALQSAGADRSVHIATKVRLMAEHLVAIRESVKRSVGGSLRRLGREQVTLLQLHNSITPNRGDEPTSITPRDVLSKGGVLEAFAELKSEGVIQHFGLTGLGHRAALAEVIESAPWATIQLCVDVLHRLPPILSSCAERGVGVIAIRVLAGGALAGQPPSSHTHTTKFFPLPVYQEDQKCAAQLALKLRGMLSVKEAAIRFVLSQPEVATALVGFARPEEIQEIVRLAEAGPLGNDELRKVCHGVGIEAGG